MVCYAEDFARPVVLPASCQRHREVFAPSKVVERYRWLFCDKTRPGKAERIF